VEVSTEREGFRASAGIEKHPPEPSGERSALVFEHGSLTVRLYAPRGPDPQRPHSRDECYVVVHGHGDFVHGGRRDRFGPGDFLFAPAGLPHRFEGFSEDLFLWVIFYGPEGGETPSPGGQKQLRPEPEG
jgi:mannose-6-phosphate isomerase-like protein (cupin superfamily)